MPDTKFIEKLLEVQFKAKGLNPIWELFSWCINSKTRQYKRVDLFLKDQLENITTGNVIFQKAISLRGNTPDDTVFNIEEWVWKNFSYKTDWLNFGMDDYWASADEIFKNRVDDCDGLNSLIYIMCNLAGITDLCIYSVLGNTRYGYHYWNLYYSPRLNKMVKLDATLLPLVAPVQDKPAFSLDVAYTRIDYIFNSTGSWRC
jgi:transglutaminase-like putative cysteine protease